MAYMRSRLYFTAILTCLTALLPATLSAGESTGPTYIIPIEGMIERGLHYAVRRGLTEARENNAGAVVIDMDTLGGKLQSAEEIIHLLLELDMPTYTFVRRDAISAGAMIALATDEIYMSPASRIGDAMPIMMSPLPTGGAQAVPEDLKPKIMSPTLAMVRATTQAKGHDTELAEAMVDPDFVYKIGDEIICDEGELVTLTNQEAERLVGEGDEQRHLLSKGTFPNLEALLEYLELDTTEIRRIEITPAEKMARAIEGFPLSSILLMLGLLGVWIEFKTPGFGFPGGAGLSCLALWFWGHHIAGLAGTSELILFILGIILLIIEIFVIPGFGLAGMAGLLAIVLALFFGMIETIPGRPTFSIDGEQLQMAVIDMGLAFVGAIALATALASLLPKSRAFHKLVLEDELDSHFDDDATKDASSMVGRQGTAVTPMRPSGIGEFGEERLNVIARGSFIDVGDPIVIAEAHGNRIVVDTLKGDVHAGDTA
jgi:membrane-bound serine protease (ClpP class)